jgi:hypothetical protein
MNRPIVAAAVLSLLTFFIHVVGGGADVHAPIQASSLAPDLRAISAVLWHEVSALLLVQGVALAWDARRSQRNKPLLVVLLALQVSFAVLFVFYGLSVLGTPWVMVQWTIFTVLAALIGWGLRPARTTAPG